MTVTLEADGTPNAYGVFSRLAADTADDAEEMLYHVLDDVGSALITMGKMVCYRAFGQVDHATMQKIIDGLHKIVETSNANKCATVSGITYYVRQLSTEEVKELLNAEATESPAV